jgi:hypothetical protein
LTGVWPGVGWLCWCEEFWWRLPMEAELDRDDKLSVAVLAARRGSLPKQSGGRKRQSVVENFFCKP